jgi:hypothetical protein
VVSIFFGQQPQELLMLAVGCAISADTQFIISASRDKSLKVWDASTGELRRIGAAAANLPPPLLRRAGEDGRFRANSLARPNVCNWPLWGAIKQRIFSWAARRTMLGDHSRSAQYRQAREKQFPISI